MAKQKIHELAKEIDKTSKDIIAVAQELGLDVKSHMSSLEDNDIKLMDLSPNSDDLTTFKEGYSLNELYEHLFIPINVVYRENEKKYVYSYRFCQ